MSKHAQSVTITHSGRSFEAIEWSPATPAGTVVVAVEGDVADLVGPVAEMLMNRYRVIGVELKSAWDVVTAAWWAADPVVVLAQGDAGRIGCEAARLAPGAVRALVLADYAPEPGSADVAGLAVPVLVFSGRESTDETHAQAVAAHSEIAGSHLIELDGCGELPTKNCATALAESVTWYLAELGKPFMEFNGEGAEPVDPRR